MFKSIRWRIAFPYILLLVITVVVFQVYLTGFIRQLYINNLEETLLAKADLVAYSLKVAPGILEDQEDLDALVLDWSNKLDARITVITLDGTVLGESHEDQTIMENHRDRPEVIAALEEGAGTSLRFSQTIGADMLYASVPVVMDGSEVGVARVALALEEIDARLFKLRENITIGTILAALLIILIAGWLSWRELRPLRELTTVARRMAEGEFEGRLYISTPGNSEIETLATALDNMAQQQRSQINDLQAERSKLSAVLLQMTDGVLIVDDQGHVVLINPAGENLFETSAPEAIGRSLVHVLRHHQFVELWRQCRETAEEQVITLELPQKKKFIQGIASPLGESLPGHSLLLFQDFTDVRRLETIRRDFISNISHELRTPLASLKALAETLYDSALDDPPTARRFLQRMEVEVDTLVHMVAELLELSRIESGRVPLQLQETDPCLLLQQAGDRLKLQAERADLLMQVSCPEGLPVVLADPPRLEQVLVNLVHNAIKFTPAGGEIELSCQLGNKDFVQFVIKDTGVGIPRDDLPRVFERFYKADRARADGGTGLGLAISRHLVEAHGGSIWVESVEGEGSTFYLTIPIADKS
ncbi:MAG: HAMP domain-containing protein [Anaerolineales bacterium]|nr:HAMP domain-containing protein [Anaerolineales bacterium]